MKPSFFFCFGAPESTPESHIKRLSTDVPVNASVQQNKQVCSKTSLKPNITHGDDIAQCISKDTLPVSGLDAAAAPRPRLRSSSFEVNLTPNPKLPTLRRSCSDGNLKSVNKRKRYPVTPMCLKRTIAKKNASKVKSSEQLEIEKIAELRRQLEVKRKVNEASLKKLGLKSKWIPAAKHKAVGTSNGIAQAVKVGNQCMKKASTENTSVENQGTRPKMAGKIDEIALPSTSGYNRKEAHEGLSTKFLSTGITVEITVSLEGKGEKATNAGCSEDKENIP